MDKLTVVITGANGFIGSYLVDYFLTRGWQVRALMRTPRLEPRPGLSVESFDLASPKLFPDLTGCDALIHCAYVKKQSDDHAGNINLDSTRHLYELAKGAGVKKFIFFSSLSAHAQAVSEYGKTKLAIEKLLDPHKDLILKPGLVLGHGGLFGSILSMIRSLPILPLVDGGSQPLQAVDIEDLAKCVEVGIHKDISGIHTLIADNDFTLRDMAELIRKRLKRKMFFLSLPYGLVNFGFTLTEALRIPLPVSKENLLGLKQNIRWEPGDVLRVFGVQPRSYLKTIERLIKQPAK
ncbi:MAG: NAD-dependent epimerase/dehydratase family protein [Anaerolineae bacterium]|nr:NAD-dependent epimerase/dehydratase family protein [Anaerolineae bacterium]